MYFTYNRGRPVIYVHSIHKTYPNICSSLYARVGLGYISRLLTTYSAAKYCLNLSKRNVRIGKVLFRSFY